MFLVRSRSNGFFSFVALGSVRGDFLITVLRCPTAFGLLPSIFQSFGVGLLVVGGENIIAGQNTLSV